MTEYELKFLALWRKLTERQKQAMMVSLALSAAANNTTAKTHKIGGKIK